MVEKIQGMVISSIFFFLFASLWLVVFPYVFAQISPKEEWRCQGIPLPENVFKVKRQIFLRVLFYEISALSFQFPGMTSTTNCSFIPWNVRWLGEGWMQRAFAMLYALGRFHMTSPCPRSILGCCKRLVINWVINITGFPWVFSGDWMFNPRQFCLHLHNLQIMDKVNMSKSTLSSLANENAFWTAHMG